jgi:TRAP-type C4-dicarboxylate transport system permease small subunit
MKRVIRVLETLTAFLSGEVQGWLLFLMMILVLVDVTTRYILQNPLSLAEEYGAYMLVAITCMGLAFAWKEGSHVRIEMLVKRLPDRMCQWLRLVTLLMAFVFTIIMILASYEMVSLSFMFGTRSGSWTRTPIAYPQIPVIIGSVLLFLQLIAEILRLIRSFKPAKGEKAHER